MHKHWFTGRLAGILILLLMVVGCASTPTPQDDDWVPVLTRDTHADPRVEAQLQRLDTAYILAQQSRYQDSLQVIRSLNMNRLPVEERWLALELAANNALALQDGRLALQMIEELGQYLPEISLFQQYRLNGLKADALILTGQLESAALFRYQQTLVAPTEETLTHSTEGLWKDLLQLNSEQLWNLLMQPSPVPLRGWVELAQVHLQSTRNLDQTLDLVEAWQHRWPQHPAALALPHEIQQLLQISQHQVAHIGIFLPASGPLAEAAQVLRDAIMAQHLTQRSQGQAVPRLTFYDTQSASLDELYRSAVAAGVEVVIGPLAKARVDLLEQRRRLPLPTLALNYGNQDRPNNRDLFQFGLSAENEAEQAAIKAWQSGFRRALVLTPESDWGSRVERRFIQAWEAQGGEVVLAGQFGRTQNLDQTLRQLLEVNQSQSRHQRLTRLLGQRPNFVAHPRQDADFLFLHAEASSARQVKPGLSFLLASSLPVVATSSVYTGRAQPSLDRDMNGLVFCDIPWYLESGDHPLRNQIRELWPEHQERYGRLYAMGLDAYLLAQRLPLFEHLPDARIEGHTGRLSQTHGRFQRGLHWAEFRSGRAIPFDGPVEANPTLVEAPFGD